MTSLIIKHIFKKELHNGKQASVGPCEYLEAYHLPGIGMSPAWR